MQKINTIGRAAIPLLKQVVVTGSLVPVVKECSLPDESRHFYYLIFSTYCRTGVAEIYGCVRTCNSKWFFGPWGYLLRNQVPRPFMPLKGQLKFFEVEYRAVA